MGLSGPQRSWYEPARPRGELLRYGFCACVVGLAAAAGAAALVRLPAGQVAAEEPDAVMVDLPPALASSRPRSDAPDGPEQAASEAAPPAPPPPPPEPDQPKPEPPPPEAPHPAAVIEDKEEAPPPPPPPAAPAPALEEQAPSGADAPKETIVEDEPPAPAPDAHAIAAWQRAMVERLERAKRGHGHATHLSGTVVVAFRIDADGHLVSKSVAKSSGSATLDAIGLALLAEAAPFPRPPSGLGEAALAFTVPVRINPHR